MSRVSRRMSRRSARTSCPLGPAAVNTEQDAIAATSNKPRNSKVFIIRFLLKYSFEPCLQIHIQGPPPKRQEEKNVRTNRASTSTFFSRQTPYQYVRRGAVAHGRKICGAADSSHSHPVLRSATLRLFPCACGN